VGRCGRERGNRAGGGAAGAVGHRYGIWKENQLDKEVWQVIDKSVGATSA